MSQESRNLLNIHFALPIFTTRPSLMSKSLFLFPIDWAVTTLKSVPANIWARTHTLDRSPVLQTDKPLPNTHLPACLEENHKDTGITQTTESQPGLDTGPSCCDH